MCLFNREDQYFFESPKSKTYKLKSKIRDKILLKEVILQGVMAIQMQENPTILEEKLLAYLKYHNKPQKVQKRKTTLETFNSIKSPTNKPKPKSIKKGL